MTVTSMTFPTQESLEGLSMGMSQVFAGGGGAGGCSLKSKAGLGRGRGSKAALKRGESRLQDALEGMGVGPCV